MNIRALLGEMRGLLMGKSSLAYWKIRFWYLREYIALCWMCFTGQCTTEEVAEAMEEAKDFSLYGMASARMICAAQEYEKEQKK